MTVLVLGATGFVGKALVSALLSNGENVRAGTRGSPPSGPSGVQWIRCDVRAPETLERAVAGIDCVYYLVHSMGEDRRTFRQTERRSANSVARAAAGSGVRRIVYLGGVAPSGPASEHLASRLEVGAILRAGTVPTVELRAAMIVGNGSTSWQILRDLALRLPFMVLPRWLESKSCPVALPDVIDALLDARKLALRESAWFDIPGPDVLSAREMLEIVGEIEGRRIPAARVPVLTPRLSAAWLKLISRAHYGIARELVLGLEHDLLPRDRRYWELTGRQPRWSFREAATLALETEGEQPGLKGWISRREEAAIRRLAPGRGPRGSRGAEARRNPH